MPGPHGRIEIEDALPDLVWLGSVGYLVVLLTWAMPGFESVLREGGGKPGIFAAAIFGVSRFARSTLGFALLAITTIAISIRMSLRGRASSFYLASGAVFLASLPFLIAVFLAWAKVLGAAAKAAG